MTEIELDETIPEVPEQIDTSINERKRSFTIADFASGHCPVCNNADIRSDMDRERYCYLCQVYAPRQVNTLPPTQQELNEGKMYIKTEPGKQYPGRPLHKFACQYPHCEETFMSHRNGKSTRKYCEKHAQVMRGEAHSRTGIAKRRLAHESNSLQDCAESTL